MINFKEMMQQAQQMQFKLQEMQAKFEDIEVSGESGAGMVKVVMMCDGNVKKVTIDPSVMDDKETLEDLIVAACADAKGRAETRFEEEMKAVTGGLLIPPGMKLF